MMDEGSELPKNESDYSDYTPSEGDREICRDYMRNVCSKGDRCRYEHPEREDIKRLLSEKSVCHDFQNSRGCNRERCKYVHITADEATYIKETGRIPAGMEAVRMALLVGDVPLCTDFLRGQCTRGDRCKFIHSKRGETGHKPDHSAHGPRFEPYGRSGSGTPRVSAGLRRLRDDDLGLGSIALEEEVVILRHQMSRLRRQVAELKVTNEDLMAENDWLRVISARRKADSTPTDHPAGRPASRPTGRPADYPASAGYPAPSSHPDPPASGYKTQDRNYTTFESSYY